MPQAVMQDRATFPEVHSLRDNCKTIDQRDATAPEERSVTAAAVALDWKLQSRNDRY